MSGSTSTAWRFPLCPEPPDWRLDFDALKERFAWLRALGDIPQDPIWHAEGDVLTHVGMVCRELVESPAWRELPQIERHIVFAAAALHDIGKSIRTTEEQGRVRSHGHTLAGARLARRILADDPHIVDSAIPFHLREQIVALVRHHGLPANFLDKPDPQRTLITASMTARCDLLSILAEADARGRICLERDEAPERARLFREFAAENNCLETPYPFISPHSRRKYFQSPGSAPTIDVFDATPFEVTILSGLPASGKDTWIETHGGDLPVISLDELRSELQVDPADNQDEVIRAAKKQSKEHLRARQSFIWNATNSTLMLREGLIALYEAYGARVRIIYCEQAPRIMREKNLARPRPVPMVVWEKLFDRLDMPSVVEAQEVDYCV